MNLATQGHKLNYYKNIKKCDIILFSMLCPVWTHTLICMPVETCNKKISPNKKHAHILHAKVISKNRSRDLCIRAAVTPRTSASTGIQSRGPLRQQADASTQLRPDAVAVGDFNPEAELRCQGRALTFPGNPTPCPRSAGEQRTQKGAGQGELCHRDEGWGDGQCEGG